MIIDNKKLEIAMANVPISYKQLERVSGVSIVTLSRIKRGVQEPRPETVGKIAKALGVKASEIITEIVEKEG